MTCYGRENFHKKYENNTILHECTIEGTEWSESEADGEIVVQSGHPNDRRRSQRGIVESCVRQAVSERVEYVRRALRVTHVAVRLILHVVVDIWRDRATQSVPRVGQAGGRVRRNARAHR